MGLLLVRRISIWNLRNRIHRTHNRLYKKFLSGLYRYLLDAQGSYVGLDTHFETHPILPHGLKGIFISNGASIGRNCVIFQHVTIGSNTIKGSPTEGCPVIGDNCYIGAGAKVIGQVTIGNNVRIGANCIVVEDIPDNAVVVMNKPRVITRSETLDNSWIRFRQWKSKEEPVKTQSERNG